jgi:asparagine synthase (glutamine-hydrolysing)
MSGIVGILRTDGAPVERELIDGLTQSLVFRGPDAQQTWTDGPVAFGHTLLRTTYEAQNECQPLTLDGNVWIVADCRVDARSELIEKLGGLSSLQNVPDVELILRAYLRWGESCLDHLLGDFAFGIWDSHSRRLFCARDHMGVKPLYYAQVGPWLIFSNTLDCIRLHPVVSDKLNDLAIADFILFGCNQEPSTTSFDSIQRLRAAHAMTWNRSGLWIRRYWMLPIEEPIYYRRDAEYIERFRSLLKQVVSDRLRTDQISIFMSGGLDSPALAATAVDLLGSPDAVHAFTFVYDRLIPDSERHYAGLVAEHLGIPIHFFAMDERAEWSQGPQTTPEPMHDLGDPEPRARFYAAMSAHSRVAFHGEGPDNALEYEWQPHLAWLAGRRRWGRLLLDVGKHVAAHKRVPLLPTLPRKLRERCDRGYYSPDFPTWLNPELVERLHLRERWATFHSGTRSDSLHPVRPQGYYSLGIPLWQSLFEGLEPSYTANALEARHPYTDVRMLSFLLSVPATPWCRSKYLLRQGLRNILPEPVRSRPKTPLSQHPDYKQAAARGLPPPLRSSWLSTYGNPGGLNRAPSYSVVNFHTELRFTCLSRWQYYLRTIATDDKERR